MSEREKIQSALAYLRRRIEDLDAAESDMLNSDSPADAIGAAEMYAKKRGHYECILQHIVHNEARLDVAQLLYHSADFEYVTPNGTRAIICLDIPQGVRITPDLRTFLDDSMKLVLSPIERSHDTNLG